MFAEKGSGPSPRPSPGIPGEGDGGIADIPVAILAGGLAKRLVPITQSVPKALVDVNGRPFIDHQLELLHRNGIRQVVLCLGHLGHTIAQHLGDGSALGMRISYAYDGDRLLGTGGALRQAGPMLGEVFWVMYGDSYMDIDYGAVLRSFPENALGLMTVIRNENRWDASNVIFRDGKLVAYDKHHPSPEMQYIDYGVALLRRAALERIEADRPYDLADLYGQLVTEGRMIGYEVTRRFYEIGTPAALHETRAYLAQRTGARDKGAAMSYTNDYLGQATQIISRLDTGAIDRMVELMAAVRERGGRVFFLGVGGSAANASHAVNDFRKIAGMEAYAPTDNVAELTARVNDDGWETVFVNWLRGSRLTARDLVFVFSVGGGDLARNISPNLVRAVQYAKATGAAVAGIVGRDGGYTAQVADACVIVPTVDAQTVTPHAEAFQAVIWHLMVTHPKLRANAMKWESSAKP